MENYRNHIPNRTDYQDNMISPIVIILTFIALILSTSNYYSESGLKTFRMFTTLSNIVAAVSASICIPFQIDGLRRDRYKLPAWIVFVMYIGVVGVFLTFSIAITLISFLKVLLRQCLINPTFFYIQLIL